MTISPIAKLANVAAAGAQTAAQARLQLIGNQITAQLNKKIAALQQQSQDPQIPLLQQQEVALSKQKTTYDNALAQIGTNGSVLGDLSLQLSDLAVAASQGNSANFDQALSAANTDVGILQIVPFTPGLQSDGVAALKSNGLAIQSSATYNLLTPAGQAQATSDVQAAQNLVQQIASVNTLNQTIGSSISQSFEGQITAITTQISNKQNDELTAAAGQVATLKQQAQTEFHLIELQFGSEGQSAGILTSLQNANNTAPPPGTILSLLVGQSGEPTLAVANLTPVTPPTVGTQSNSNSAQSSSNSSALGNNVSTTA